MRKVLISRCAREQEDWENSRVLLVLMMPLPLSDIYGTILINYQVYNTYCLCGWQNHADCAQELFFQIKRKRPVFRIVQLKYRLSLKKCNDHFYPEIESFEINSQQPWALLLDWSWDTNPCPESGYLTTSSLISCRTAESAERFDSRFRF